jgi:hypothetical protein
MTISPRALSTYLVFGDLHGRVLPAFALARAWQREHEEPLAGLLQVGDLGYFPRLDRLDKATKRHAARDPLELGARQVIFPSKEADALFADPDVPSTLWFIAGNHEDHEMLADCYGRPGTTDVDFPVDHYGRVRCIVDGSVLAFPDGLRIGGLWGIDDEAPGARRHTVVGAKLNTRRARDLAVRPHHVLLSHESARDAFFLDAGSLAISTILHSIAPAYHFFGHYHGIGRMDECDFKTTRLLHLVGLEFRGKGGCGEERSVGVLRWQEGHAAFDYVDEAWLRGVTRHNWSTR